jgi:hypothetical protein
LWPKQTNILVLNLLPLRAWNDKKPISCYYPSKYIGLVKNVPRFVILGMFSCCLKILFYILCRQPSDMHDLADRHTTCQDFVLKHTLHCTQTHPSNFQQNLYILVFLMWKAFQLALSLVIGPCFTSVLLDRL